LKRKLSLVIALAIMLSLCTQALFVKEVYAEEESSPIVDSGIITVGDITQNSMVLSWEAATDTVTETVSLEYEVVYSAEDNISTVADAVENGTVVREWTANLISTEATGLNPDITYYFNVIVRNQAGKMSVYSTNMQKTEPLASEEVDGASEEVAGASEEVAGVSEEVAGVSEEVAGASEEVAGVSEEVAGANEGIMLLLGSGSPVYSGTRAVFGGENGTELFLGGNYMELGISNWGDFGTIGDKPSNFRGTSYSNNIGMSADHDGFDFGNDLPIDYYLPGDPEERFAVGYKVGGIKHTNTNSALENDRNMHTTVANLSDMDKGLLKAKTVSTWAGKMEISQEISFNVNDKFYRNEVTLKNISGEAWDGARYMRSLDPDNTAYISDAYETRNVVTHTVAEDGKAVVKAETYYDNDPIYQAFGSRAPIFFYSKDTKAVASIFGFTNKDPYETAAYDNPQPKNASIDSDIAITMTWDSGPLQSGESKKFVYYVSMDERDFDEVVEEIPDEDVILTWEVVFQDHDGSELKKETVDEGESATPPASPTREGYRFAGWSTEPGYENVTSNRTITAQYVKIWNVVFKDHDGKTLKTEIVNEGKAATAPTAPKRTGYSFTGWSGSFDNVTSDLTITAQYDINTYDVKYSAGANGSITGNASQSVSYGDDALEVTAVPAEGYHFTSWSDGVKAASRTDKGVTGSIDVTASFEINSYVVTFNSNGGSTVAAQSLEHGQKAVKPQDPTREGFVFGGWYADAGLTTPFNFEAPITGTASAYAKWDVATYSVNFADYNGNVIKTETVEHGKAATAPTDPERTGYSFKGWSGSFDNVTSDLTITAQYDINTYDVKYSAGANGSITGNASQSVSYGDDALEVTAVPAEGYHFTSWSDGVKAASRTDKGVTGSIDVTASFEINSYVVTFNSNGGSTVAAQSLEHGQKAVKPQDPTREGFVFGGWYADAGLTTPFNFEAPITGTALAYAKWDVATYSVNFADYNGNVIKTETVEHSKAATPPASPTREGYRFTGWRTELGYENVTSNRTVTAQYVKTWEVVFKDHDGNILKTEIVDAGKAATTPTAPERTGYSFKGWSESFDSVTSDLTITAQYDINTYDIKYSAGANGSITGNASQSVSYGNDALEVTAVPAEGYHFTSWSDGVTTAGRTDKGVTDSIDLTASFEINSYAVTFNSSGGSAVAAQSVEHGQKVLMPSDPTKSSYKFGGWYKESSHENLWDFNADAVRDNTELHAKWTRISSGGSTNKIPTPQPEASVIVKVNGKEEDAGTETLSEVDGKSTVEVKVKPEIIEKKIEEAIKVQKQETQNIIEVSMADKASDSACAVLTGDIVKKLEDNDFAVAVLRENVQYNIPARELTIESVAEKLNVAASLLRDISVEVQISKVDEKVIKQYEAIARKNASELVVAPVEFNIIAKTTKTNGATDSVSIGRFSSFVERVLEIPEGVDLSKITTGIVFNNDGSYSHVPTAVFEKNGKHYAKLNSLTNSNYSVIWNPVTVDAVKGHWSESAVKDMASRLVVADTKDFKPDQAISRADFANYIVRALGLYREDAQLVEKLKFTDIDKKSVALTGINIASEWGIVSGYTDGTFRPDSTITREEAMVMYSRAMKIVKFNGEGNNRIVSYKDAGEVAPWAYEAVSKTIASGIFNGRSKDTIVPRGTFTHAEAATAIRNLLVESGLINR